MWWTKGDPQLRRDRVETQTAESAIKAVIERVHNKPSSHRKTRRVMEGWVSARRDHEQKW